jgi:cyclopropane-fatty-acyl-phospholipid synthase
MNVALRREPSPRLPLAGRLGSLALRRVAEEIEGGTLVVRMPDGSRMRLGSGRPVEMTIDDERLFHRLVLRPRLGLGESYQAGEWRADDLPALLELLARNADRAASQHPHLRRLSRLAPRVNRRTGLLAARRNVEYHYDLGNELFERFLDETMTYSCAVFASEAEPLADAQRRKLRLVCERLELGSHDRVLEIGCGWGSFALTAAGEYGAHVTAITISPAQAELTRRRVAEAGLQHRVDVRLQDFREVEGTFTKVASIEMIEAIGERLLVPFFATIERVLAAGGRACVQSILVPDTRYRRYRASPDWIERYIFPGCLIPSLGVLAETSRPLRIRSVHHIGEHYAETLARWRTAFLGGLDEVRGLGFDERFVRTWDFYLASCQALFSAGLLDDAQLVLTR